MKCGTRPTTNYFQLDHFKYVYPRLNKDENQIQAEKNLRRKGLI